MTEEQRKYADGIRITGGYMTDANRLLPEIRAGVERDTLKAIYQLSLQHPKVYFGPRTVAETYNETREASLPMMFNPNSARQILEDLAKKDLVIRVKHGDAKGKIIGNLFRANLSFKRKYEIEEIILGDSKKTRGR